MEVKKVNNQTTQQNTKCKPNTTLEHIRIKKSHYLSVSEDRIY